MHKGAKVLLFCSLFLLVFPVSADLAQENGSFEVLVQFTDESLPRLIAVKAENIEQAISLVKALPNVRFAEVNSVYHSALTPTDTYLNKQWYLQKIKAKEAWNIVHDSSNVVVAVLDSGVDIGHQDLRGNIWVNQKEIPDNKVDDDNNGFIDDVNGWNFVRGNNDPRPSFETGYNGEVLHGTIVAGILGATGNNEMGISGVTWKTQLMPVRVLNDRGEGNVGSVIQAIDYAILNKAQIINLSFVGTEYSQGLAEAIRRAYNAGIIIVAAAGNDTLKTGELSLDKKPLYPVCMDGAPGENQVIGVAATDAIDQKAHFSGFGSRCIDISAPGISIFSTSINDPSKNLAGEPLTKYYDGYWSGTSVAAPMVSAALSLIKQANPLLGRKELIEVLLSNTDSIDKLNPDYIGKLGTGRLNIERSLIDARFRQVQVTNEIVVSMASMGSRLRIFDSEGKVKNNIIAFPGFSGGVNLATGDVDGDGVSEIIVAPASNGGPQVRIFDNNGKVEKQFFVFDKAFRGGVNLATGDVDGDGVSEIIVAPASNGGPQVRVFSYLGVMKGAFWAGDQRFRGGVKIAVGDFSGQVFDKYSSIVTLITGATTTEVKLYDRTFANRSIISLRQSTVAKPSSLSVADVNHDGVAEVLVGSGSGEVGKFSIINSKGRLLGVFLGFDPGFKYGVNLTALKK